MGWINNIFDNSKEFEDKINGLQDKLRKANALNVSYEDRIAEKELEISKADKSIQRIIQIWKTINSSESLPKVLATIISGFSNDLDFLYCLLFQIHHTKDGIKLKASVASEIGYFNLEGILGNKLNAFGIPYECDENSLVGSIKSQKILPLENFQDIFKGSDLVFDKYKLDRLESIFIDRAITVLPLMVQGEPFGCLVAVSLKKEVNNMDKNYLKLFAGQIELSVSMSRLLENMKTQAVTDALTGLYNRRYYNESLSKEMKKAQRAQRPFTLITLDLDHLKQINDNYGHTAGDAAIAEIGSVLLKSARESDIPARFGGEEFALIMPDTDIDGGVDAAERIRALIASKKVEGVGTITASIGVATFLKHANTIEELVELVDQAMYSAKKNGRNRVEVAGAYEKFDWIPAGLEIFMSILANRDLPIKAEIADKLINKIESEIPDIEDMSKILFNNVYLLIKNYDPLYPSGIIRLKLDLIEKIADKIQLAKHETDKIKLAAILCDIGKIMIPKEILLKDEASLTEAEKKKLLQHPALIIEAMLKPTNKPAIESILPIILHHHDEIATKSLKLVAEELPVGSKIIHLVNTYMDLINKKPYREAYYVDEALDILNQEADVRWDGKLINILNTIISDSQ